MGDHFQPYAAVYLIFKKEGKILMLRRANTGYEDGRYSLPAGHIYEYEPLKAAAVREAQEETGVVIDPDHLQHVLTLHRNSGDRVYVDFFFLVKEWEHEPRNCEPEKCDDLSWFPLDALPGTTVTYVREAIDHFLNGVHYAEFGWDKKSGHPSARAFTLIELLVVIAIIAILAVVVVLTLNPAQLLAQSRDANRVSDMATLNSAINLYNTDQSGASSYSLGNGTSTYISIPDPTASSTCGSLGLPSLAPSSTWACSTTSNYRNASSSGWLPINFQNISSGAPFGSLPSDPVNTTSSGLYYAYLPSPTTQGSYEVLARLESQKYASPSGAGNTDGGMSYQYLEAGKDLTLAPTYAPKVLDRVSSTDYLALDTNGLVGYWPLNEGGGATAYDQSGYADNGAAVGSINWTTSCKTGSACLSVPAAAGYISVPYASQLGVTKNFTIAHWIDVTASIPSGSWPVSFGNSGHAGYILGSNSNGTVWRFEFATDYPTCSGSAYTSIGATSLTIGTWNFLAATYDGVTASLYVNGALVASTAGPASGNMCAASSTNLFFIGAPTGAGSGSYTMSDARLYNRVLSAAEIQELYNAGK